MKKLYFAYGSNLDINRLQARIGKVKVIGVTTVYGWKLVFNAGQGKQCFANMQMTGNPTDSVDGAVYEISPVQLRKLDTCEGAPHFYTRMIYRFNNKDLHMYVSINPHYTQQQVRGISPARDYLDFMIKGSVDFKLGNLMKVCGILYNTAPKVGGTFK